MANDFGTTRTWALVAVCCKIAKGSLKTVKGTGTVGIDILFIHSKDLFYE
jgi:hypothetical protein